MGKFVKAVRKRLRKDYRKLERGYWYSFGASEHFVKWYGKKLGMRGVEKWPTTGADKFFLKEEKRIGLMSASLFKPKRRKK